MHPGKSAQEALFSTFVNQQQPQSADQNTGELFDTDVLPVDQKADYQQCEGETHTRCQRTVTHFPAGAVQKHIPDLDSHNRQPQDIRSPVRLAEFMDIRRGLDARRKQHRREHPRSQIGDGQRAEGICALRHRFRTNVVKTVRSHNQEQRPKHLPHLTSSEDFLFLKFPVRYTGKHFAQASLTPVFRTKKERLRNA